MVYYQFESEWVITSKIDDVYEALLRYEDFPKWWSSVKKVRLLDEGDHDHLGARAGYSIRSPLFYSLDFEVTISGLDRLRKIQISATGDLAGVGTYLLSEHKGTIRILYLWNVATTKSWMNLVAPVARPLFVWAHHSVMREGGAGLAEHLGGRLISCSSRLANNRIGAESAPSGVS